VGEHAGGEHSSGAHGAGHCPGHGPTDRPPPPNLTHGWLGVNNEKAPHRLAANVPTWRRVLWSLTPYPYRYENEKDPCDPRNQPTPLIAPIFNFAVLAFIIFRFGRKPLVEALRKRKVSIMSEIERAEEIKDKAQDRLDHYESELDHLDEKLGLLREQYAAEAAGEKKAIVKEAGEARDRLMADAEFRVRQEGKVARDELSREAMKQALAAAEELLRQRVTQQDHDRLAEEFLHQIGPALQQQGLSESKGGRQ
jgi:F-type H+-transporting ATPase subunit b